jgi:Cof subfamily protein (haloacid dehalogenase superfamily)
MREVARLRREALDSGMGAESGAESSDMGMRIGEMEGRGNGELPIDPAPRSDVYTLPMNVDLIALDLDDTLLGPDLDISEGNRSALALAETRGIKIVLASGRNIHSMRRYVSLLGLDGEGDYLICNNGAEIFESWSGKPVDRSLLSPGLCGRVARAIEERGFPWQVYDDGNMYWKGHNPWAGRDRDVSGQKAVPVTDEEAFFSGGRSKFVVPGEEAEIARLIGELGPLFADEVELITSKPYLMEVMPRGVDKGRALGRLAALLGIGMERTMAVGDAMNDLGMVRAAGWGCAPANANGAVRQAARLVSAFTNGQDAVADLVRQVALS